MTRLSEEILKAFAEIQHSSFQKDYANAAAEVAKRYIEKAFDAGYNRGASAWGAPDEVFTAVPSEKQEWMKENGVL
jgi:hypothetical protein